MRKHPSLGLLLAGVLAVPAVAFSQSGNELVLEHKGETIVLEPYADNIVRVTLSLQRESAFSKPGYGFVGTANSAGWSSSQTDVNDVYRSSRMMVTVEREHPPLHPKLPTEL